MIKFFKSLGPIALFLIMSLISVLPLVVLNFPWWADLIYYALLALGFAQIAFPVVLIWAFIVEVQQPTHDFVGIAVMAIFGIAALSFLISLFSSRD